MVLSAGKRDDEYAQRTKPDLAAFLNGLRDRGIGVQVTDGRECPTNALMHDKAAIVPAVIVSPKSEWGVVQTLRLLKTFGLYSRAVSVKSGGHGYFNGGTCSDIMLDLSSMSKRTITDNVLHLEPGCILAPTVDVLAKHGKAVPHGDCFAVGAGGHFLTAGWDILLTRIYGLGCQSVIGGRVILWDGKTADVTEDSHPDLLHAMRGGAAAGVGVVTEIRLRLHDEPSRVSWRFTPITKEQMTDVCVAQRAFERARSLPREISVSFRFHFELGAQDPSISFNIVSILSAEETIRLLQQHLGLEVTALVSDISCWSEKTMMDLRMLPASETLASNPGMLGEATADAMKENPEVFWSKKWCLREMSRSYFTTISHWVTPDCETMFPELFAAFESARDHPCRERMSALVILGEGRMQELPCAMPLGGALARFEQHWDSSDEEQQCRDITEKVFDIFKTKGDPAVDRPYRGDIWLPEQGEDMALNKIYARYATK